MWPGVEPTQGNYNNTYLDQIMTLVQTLGAEDIEGNMIQIKLHNSKYHSTSNNCM